MKQATVDFETKMILRRPDYPPVPVGVAIRKPGDRKPKYWAWGHPSANNCTWAQGQAALQEVWNGNYELLFHNAKFDTDVAAVHMGLPVPRWDRVHDTLYLLFLNDPHARNLGLKPSAERLLGMPPDERDAVEDWLKTNAPDIRTINPDTGKPHGWRAYTSQAPGDIVGRYAGGDITRTDGLFKPLYKDVVAAGMLPAYNRERQLMPILLANETQGIRVNLDLLRTDVALYTAALEKTDKWLCKRLGKPDLNIDSDDDFGQALDQAGIVTDWVLTATGKKSVSKRNLTLDMFNDSQVASAYNYRNRVATCLRMFMVKWLEQASSTGGTIHTNWNQVRQTHGDEKLAGARSGRLSSNPNFQNLPTEFDYVHPVFLRVPQLPNVRRYLLPDRGGVWLHRDWNQQELRMLGHFENGPLMQAYIDNDDFDVHSIIHDTIKQYVGTDFPRKRVKMFVFQVIYGGGMPAIMDALQCDYATAVKVLAALMIALPGYKRLRDAVIARAKTGLAITTWGGRDYYVEQAAYSKKFGRVMDFYYKLVNYLIQGSSSDVTKEALIRYDAHPRREARFLVTVHDEINSSSPPARSAKARLDIDRREMRILDECMRSIEVDVPMTSKGKIGPSWGDIGEFKEAV